MIGIKKLHFIGIGGIGMSGIAEILRNTGFEITGSDLEKNSVTENLEKIGIRVHYGHKPENIDSDTDICVYSSAINEGNPEMKKARDMNIPVIKRAEVLAELMRIKNGIAIAGSHGKSSTTALCGKVFLDCNMDPTIIIGGRFDYIKSNVKLGEGKFFIAEADESDKSFLLLSPVINIITSIDNDHLDNYGDMDNLRSSFIEFAMKVPFFGFNILNYDDENIKKIMPEIRTKCYTYGFSHEADLYCDNVEFKNGSTHFDVFERGRFIDRFSIPYPGMHYVSNALSVICLAKILGIDILQVKSSISTYKGLERRMDLMGKYKGTPVYNDYGHHPTEIKFTLSAFKNICSGRLITIFQPHRYSRLKLLYDDFVASFKDTDLLFISDVYPAGETHCLPDSNILAESIGKISDNVFYVNNKDPKEYLEKIGPNADDIILFLGAGNYYLKGYGILE